MWLRKAPTCGQLIPTWPEEEHEPQEALGPRLRLARAQHFRVHAAASVCRVCPRTKYDWAAPTKQAFWTSSSCSARWPPSDRLWHCCLRELGACLTVLTSGCLPPPAALLRLQKSCEFWLQGNQQLCPGMCWMQTADVSPEVPTCGGLSLHAWTYDPSWRAWKRGDRARACGGHSAHLSSATGTPSPAWRWAALTQPAIFPGQRFHGLGLPAVQLLSRVWLSVIPMDYSMPWV